MLRTYTCIKGVVVVGLIAALTPALAVLWAQPLQQQQTLTPLVGTDGPPTETAQVDLVWFTDQAEFEAFVARQGKFLKGIEDFEESILPPGNFDLFDDPLESGVPCLPPGGCPFPDGLTGLPNLIVQSNVGGGNPTVPNPRGVNGLAAVAVGAVGAVSDVVVPIVDADDSLDLIFTDEKSGVGFNPISLGGGQVVTVRVYSTTNVFLGMITTPADAAGTNFLGVWASEPIIGRINIFDSGNPGEGADNIQAWQAGPLPTGACCFNDGQCSMETEADCKRSGGTYQGDDTGCKPNPCPQPPTGACCLADGSCFVLELDDCNLAGGTYQGDDTDCRPNPCFQPCPWDFDDNGSVGATDLLALLVNWGPCP